MPATQSELEALNANTIALNKILSDAISINEHDPQATLIPTSKILVQDGTNTPQTVTQQQLLDNSSLTASNIGSGSAEVFKQKLNNSLELRTIESPDETLNISSDGDEVDIDVSDDAIDNNKLSDMTSNSVKANNTASTADPSDIVINEDNILGRLTGGNLKSLTKTETTTIINEMVGDTGAGGLKGLVPQPVIGDETKFLKGNGTWQEVPVALPQYSVGNSSTALNQLIPTGDPTTLALGYNLLTSFLESNESQESDTLIVYRDVADSIQSTYLDETNNKFIFPSNINTFANKYISYFIRIVTSVDLQNVNNSTTKYYIRLRRVIDDSIIATDQFIQSDFNAQNGLIITSEIKTFVNSETDPFVIDGCYFDILNDSNSSGSVTLQNVSIRIFRD